MDNQNVQEIWQVDVNGEIYETNLAGLGDWIAEGSLQPQDKVRRGNLRWLEAGKIPFLNGFFNAKDLGIAPPVFSTTDAQKTPEDLPDQNQELTASPDISQSNFDEPKNGAVVAIPRKKVKSARVSAPVQNARVFAADEKFGFSDFAKALVYPFKFKASLIFGAIFFTVFTLGQSVWVFGGVMLVSAVFCAMLANTLTFGILANTVENFAQGKIDADFMPRFDDFSAWDDVIHPFLLSIGVYIVSFGVLFALLVGATWQAVNSLAQIDEGKQKIVSTVLPVPPNDTSLTKQSAQVRQLTEQFKKDNNFKNGNMPDENAFVQSQINGLDEAPVLENLQNRLKQSEQPLPEPENNNLSEMPGNVMRLSLGFAIPIFLAFLWGFFYFPAACLVAGYTRSFTAIFNPLIAFDTIKRLGLDYAKILGMCLFLGVFAALINIFLGKLFAPLNLPQLGNMAVKTVDGFLYFYIAIVFSVVLGFVVYKNSKSLNLFRS